MAHIDTKYLCTVIGNLAGIPVRIFEEGRLVFFHCLVPLPKDPLVLYKDRILGIQKSVGYYLTDPFGYYGIVNTPDQQIVIGPTQQTPIPEQELRKLAFRLDVAADDTAEFIRAMKSIICMPVESVLQILCTLNHVLNGENLALQDIMIFDSAQDSTLKRIPVSRDPQSYSADNLPQQGLHNTFQIEQVIMDMVRTGDTAKLNDWMTSAPAAVGGILAPDQLRQRKNTFIVSATLASRAAIRGGLDVEDAFRMSDSYIQKCERYTDPDLINNLQYHMIREFTERVSRVRVGKHPSKLALDVANYIQHHLSEPITAEKIAAELFMSRPYLSRKFKEETGSTLTDFILKEKTEEAKRLLRYSDKSLSAIGHYLGFSSQAHFSRVFKKYTEKTPGEYRERYNH